MYINDIIATTMPRDHPDVKRTSSIVQDQSRWFGSYSSGDDLQVATEYGLNGQLSLDHEKM